MTNPLAPNVTEPETDAQPSASPESDLAETALVEEVSIDGMCGVY